MDKQKKHPSDNDKLRVGHGDGERRNGEKQISRQTYVLDAINRVFHEALTCENEEELGKTCLAVAEKLTGSKFGFIGELNQAGSYDTIAISNPGWDACKMPESEATRLLMNMPLRGIWTRPLKDGKSLMLADPSSHPDSVGTPEGHPPITSFLGVPLKHKDRTFGMFALGNKEGGYDVADKEAAESLSVAIVVALRSKRAEEMLKATNQQLQASEQQLIAANQQLQASEQQLRAANQQLRANDQQLRAANQQLQASEQQLKAANQQLRASEEELRKLTHNMGERIKELNCLYGLSLLIEQRDIKLEEIFQSLSELIPPGWHYPEITCARVVFGDREFKTANFKKTKWEQSADIKVSGRKAGAVEVYYLKECPILDEGPFLKEERNLINGISRALGEAIQHKQAEEKLRESEANYRSIFENALDMIHEVNEEGRIVGVNRIELETLGYSREEFLTKPLLEIVSPDYRKVTKKVLEKVLDGEPVREYETVFVSKTGKRILVEVNVVPKMAGEKVVGARAIIRDITERKRAEDAVKSSNYQLQISEKQLTETNQQLIASEQQLKASNQQLQAEVAERRRTELEKESLSKFPAENPNPVLRIRKDGEVLYVNEAGQILLAKWKSDVGEAVPEKWRNLIAEAFQSEKGKTEEEEVEDRIFALSIAPVKEAGYANIYAREITEQKQSEKMVIEHQNMLRSMTSELSLAEEHQRRDIAEGLHDDIIQPLTFLGIKLDLHKKAAKESSSVESFNQMQTTIENLISTARTLTFDLSSPVLHELGLEAAIQDWLTENIQKKHGIATTFEYDSRIKPLEEDLRIVLFKAVKELLSNVVKYAQAGTVKVSAVRDDNKIKICVEDNGIGFDALEKMCITSKSPGYGLFHISERLDYLGGRFEIISKHGQGTQITMVAPLGSES